MNERFEYSKARSAFERKQIIVKAGRTLLVSGPSMIELIDGKATIYASPLDNGRRIDVVEGKQLPVEAIEDSTLDCYLSSSATCSEIDGNGVPDSWMETAQTILETGRGKAVVVGNVDSGKSAFCTILANLALESGMKTGILDADLGQSDIGPPATIGYGIVESHLVSLSEVTPALLYFIGYISPEPVTLRVIDGIEKLLNNAKKVDMLVVNTDGWVLDDQAVIYKKLIIDSIEPDYVVGIGKESEIKPLLQLTKTSSFQISSPSTVLKRSRDQRKQLREFGYRRFLTDGKLSTVNTDKVQVFRSDGKMVNPKNVDQSLVGSLVGLLDDHDWLLGIGVLMQIVSQGFQVFSPVTKGFSKVEIGAVKIDEHGNELSYLE